MTVSGRRDGRPCSLSRRRHWRVLGRPARAEVTRAEVEKAIRDGVRLLKHRRTPTARGRGQPGTTELAILALLTAGQPADEPALARALAGRPRRGPGTPGYGTYAVALQTMALAAADPAAYRAVDRPQRRLARTGPDPQLLEPGADGVGGGSWTYHACSGRRRATTRTRSTPCSG